MAHLGRGHPFKPLVQAFRVPAAGGSTLFNGCVAAWKLSDLTDATGRGNTLTNNNTATFNTGKIGNAVYVSAASTQFLSKVSSADVGLTAGDFTIGLWAYVTAFDAGGGKNIAVGKDASGQRDYYIYTEDVTPRFKFSAFSGGVQKDVVANTFGTPVISTWYCVIVWWDATSQTMRISVNDGAADSTVVGAALDGPGTADFRIGARAFAGFENYWDGRIDAVHIWKRVLTSGERTEFYNSGTGIEFTAGTADVTVGLTGVSATSSAGSLGVDRSSSLTGNAATASSGTLAPSLSASISGNAATASVGSVTTSRTVGLAGVVGSTSVGTLDSARTVSISGNSATTDVGTLTPVVGVTVALTGVSATASVGSLSPSLSTALAGVEATSAVGTLTPSIGIFVTLTGVEATASAGDLSPSTGTELTGDTATASVGTLSAERSVTITGVEATTTVGSLAPSLTVSLTGVEAVAAVGTLSILSADALAVSKNVGSAILFTAHVGTGVLRIGDTRTATLITTNADVAEIVYQDVRTDT